MAADFDDEMDDMLGMEDEGAEERDPYLEINELKQKLSLLQKTKEAQRARYKKEMHMIVNALISKHKELQKENHFLQQQVQQLLGEGSGDEDFITDLKHTLEDQKKEMTVLKKMVQQYESQNQLHRQEQAELEALRELIEEKDQFIQELEGKNQEVLYQLEAKDGIIARISSQVANMEAEVYALNKRMRATGSQQDQAYLDELSRLKNQIAELEEKKNHFENLARQAHELRKQQKLQEQQAAEQAAQQSVEGTVEAAAPAEDEAEYEEAMDMLLQELQENLSTYDQISTQFSKARV
ncbi:MAG: hypothetical protein IGS03_02400 [Candidatus Sericytochromatia bacterium]|nr:hypothetical protein [Candidatus Sericytochromatia bacterium]